MITNTAITYVGDDFAVGKRLSNVCVEHDWSFRNIKEPGEFISYLHQRRVNSPTNQVGCVDDLKCPVILELDFSKSESLETVREIKQMSKTIPIIVLGHHVSLAAVAVAQMDGAEGFFHKPTLDMETLVKAIRECIARSVHWQESLRSCTTKEPRSQEPSLSENRDELSCIS